MLTNGKNRKILAGTLQDIFRLIQSIPSPKAEPFKQWLAKVGYERIQEFQILINIFKLYLLKIKLL